MSDAIDSVAALERVAGGQPLSALLKSIDVFDAHCEALLARSPLAILTWCEPDGGQRALALGGAPGFAWVEGPRVLAVPAPELGAPRGGVGAALLFFVPGLGETLRVNGRATSAGEVLRVELQEAFGHCAKALIRSALWERVRGSVASPDATPAPAAGAPGPLGAPDVAAFLARSPFLAIGSASEQGACDVSPRGDPPGFARILDGETLALPERRGNRRTDTLRNLLGRPAAALVAIVPGDPRTLELGGRASLTREPALLESMAVGGKAPKVALLVRVARARLAESPALAASGLWDASRFPDLSGLPPMARVFADHVRQNRRRGVAAAAIRALASERLLAPALKRDYEEGLY